MRNQGLGELETLGWRALPELGNGNTRGIEQQAGRRRAVPHPGPAPARGAELSLRGPPAPPWGSSSPDPHHTLCLVG